MSRCSRCKRFTPASWPFELCKSCRTARDNETLGVDEHGLTVGKSEFSQVAPGTSGTGSDRVPGSNDQGPSYRGGGSRPVEAEEQAPAKQALGSSQPNSEPVRTAQPSEGVKGPIKLDANSDSADEHLCTCGCAAFDVPGTCAACRRQQLLDDPETYFSNAYKRITEDIDHISASEQVKSRPVKRRWWHNVRRH